MGLNVLVTVCRPLVTLSPMGGVDSIQNFATANTCGFSIWCGPPLPHCPPPCVAVLFVNSIQDIHILQVIQFLMVMQLMHVMQDMQAMRGIQVLQVCRSCR